MYIRGEARSRKQYSDPSITLPFMKRTGRIHAGTAVDIDNMERFGGFRRQRFPRGHDVIDWLDERMGKMERVWV